MKRKILLFSILIMMLLAFTAEGIYAWGGASPSGGGHGGGITPPPPRPQPQPPAKETLLTAQAVIDSLNVNNVRGLVVVEHLNFDGTQTGESLNPRGLVSTIIINYGGFDGYICQFDSRNNAKAEAKKIEKANEDGGHKTWSEWNKNIVIMLHKDFPEEQKDMIFDILENMEAK